MRWKYTQGTEVPCRKLCCGFYQPAQKKTHPDPVKISLGCNRPTASRMRTRLWLASVDSRRASQEWGTRKPLGKDFATWTVSWNTIVKANLITFSGVCVCVCSFKGSLLRYMRFKTYAWNALSLVRPSLWTVTAFLCWKCLQVAHLSSRNALSRCISVIWADVAHGSLPRLERGKLNTSRISWEWHLKSHSCPSWAWSLASTRSPYYLCQQSLSEPHLGTKDQTPTNVIEAHHVGEIETLD